MKNLKLKIIKLISYIIAKYYLRDARRSEWIFERYQDLPTIFAGALNQLCYIIRIPYVYRLTSITIEISNRCNLRCIMCAHNKGMKRMPKDMEFNLLEKIITQTHTYIKTICFSGVGEPFMNPNIFRMIEHIKKNDKKVVIYTNGTLLDEEKMLRLLKLKVDILIFSVDGTKDSYEIIRGWSYEDIKKKILKFIELRNKFKKNTKIKIATVIFEKNERELKNFDNYWRNVVDGIKYRPRILECEKEKEKRPRKICREPWYGNFFIGSNGEVVCCCGDCNGELALGNILEQELKDIWRGERLRDLRRRHLKGNFPDRCKICYEYQSLLYKPQFRGLSYNL